MARAKEIQMIEEELIAEGKLPKEGYTENEEHSVEIEEDNYEMELVREYFLKKIEKFLFFHKDAGEIYKNHRILSRKQK